MKKEQLLDKLLSQSVEDETLEFKAAKNKYGTEDLAKYAVALANSALKSRSPFAYFVLGVNDATHEVTGTSAFITKKQQNEALMKLANGASPKLDVEFIVACKNGKKAVILKIRKPSQPTAWKNHYYIRDGESLGTMSIDQINAFNQPFDWSAEPCLQASIRDIDPEAIERGKIEFKQRHPSLTDEIDHWGTEEFLQKLRLLVNGVLTNAAILLFGKPESSSLLNPSTSRITWTLVDDHNIPIAYEHFYSPLILTADQILKKIRNLKYSHIVQGSIFPDELLQYDPWLLREALANAIAHQDYTVGKHILITESADGKFVKFRNAGSFIPGSVENVLSTYQPSLYVRNRTLVDAMIKIKMMENVNSGIPKMFRVQQERTFPLPDYKIENNEVELTISGQVVDQEWGDILKQNPSLSLLDVFLLEKLLYRKKKLPPEQINYLRSKKLIKGKAPYTYNGITKKRDFIREHYFNDEKMMDAIVQYIKEKDGATKADLFVMMQNVFPSRYTEQQKNDKLKNLLQKLKRNNVIYLYSRRVWKSQPEE